MYVNKAVAAEALQKLAQAESLILHQKDEVLRVQAEMQNLRRREEKLSQQIIRWIFP